ncbi:MAG TPA: asparagine synthase (glutamine-hydrolyzing) [Ktedonobacterales bacterium]
MCGIAGFIDSNTDRGKDDVEQLIASMCAVIRHRGPDDQGVWVGGGVALGMRRLAIIDVAGGHQPVFNEDQTVLIVFNGEIYNYRDLQRDLRKRGHRFRTDTDTEVIVHAYEEYGDDCVQHLRGMFTFALWDTRRQRLLAARDRFGKKPLNYYWDGQKLIFGSEIKSILQTGIPRDVNPIALDEYLVYGYVPTPHTLFEGVYKVPAAHILIYEDGKISTKRYWEPPTAPTRQDDEPTAVERTRELLNDAVAVRLMSEVPLGAFLSGGIDSSLVVGIMSQTLSQPVKTFSIGFEEEDFSELPYARLTARHFGTDHHEFIVRPELVSVLPELVWAYDEPFADQSMLPTYYVSKLAREFVTVVLTGDGGDEIFGGYVHYAREQSIARLPRSMRCLLERGAMLLPDGMRGKRRLSVMGQDLPTRYAKANMRYPYSWRSSMYRPEMYASVVNHDPLERQVSIFRSLPPLDLMAQMQHVDTQMYLPDDILVKVDKASMLNSLETRAPLLDQNLVEYVWSLQPAVRTPHGRLKHLLKKIASDMLPPEILRRRKWGFSIPADRWLRGELAEYATDMLLSTRTRDRGIFRPAFIRDLLSSHARSGLIHHGSMIWALLCLELWFQVYLDAAPIQLPHGTYVDVARRR